MDVGVIWQQIRKIFRPFSRWLQDLLGGIPFLAWISLFLGILLIIGSYFLVQYFIKKERVKPTSKSDGADPQKAVYKLPPVGG